MVSASYLLQSANTGSFLSLGSMRREGVFCVLIRDVDGLVVDITLGLDGIRHIDNAVHVDEHGLSGDKVYDCWCLAQGGLSKKRTGSSSKLP